MDITGLNILYDFDDSDLTEGEQASVSSAADALIRCVNKFGRVDLNEMSDLSGMGKPELIFLLAGKAIFQNPAVFLFSDRWSEDDGWLLASQYICGNIPEKLRIAREVNAKFCCFDKNIAALEKLVPDRIDSSSIRFSLGAPWISTEYYQKFIASLLQIGQKHIAVNYNRELGIYGLDIDNKELLKKSVLNNLTFGIPEMPAFRIIEHIMNNKTVKVYDSPRSTGNQAPVLNQDKTVAAQEKQSLILEKFDAWVHENKKRTEALCDLYNDTYIGYVFTPFDGSILDFADLNPDITLFSHQKNTVARILLSEGNLLLAQAVGTGKTYEMIVGAHELYRTGLSRKNLIVVPNNVLNATVSRHRQLYPRDHILAVNPADFTPANRNAILNRIRDEDFVSVYMAFSSFDLIVMSKEYWVAKRQAGIDRLRRAASFSTDEKERKRLRKEAEKQSERLNKYILEEKPCEWLTFDALGIETLIVDEAHNYKNIPLRTRADNITGLHTAGSKKCIEMLEKAHSVKRIIMTTGTPLTNSLADLFVFQQFLQPEELKYRGIDTLDAWIKTFAEPEQNYEIDIDARHLKLTTTFSKFHNLPELFGILSLVFDFYSSEDKSGIPRLRGYETVVTPRTTGQELYIDMLSARADAVHNRCVSRETDNLLKITTEGRLCALDIRLIDPDLYDDSGEQTKVNECAKRILHLYRTYPGTCQIVFCDIGTPKSSFNEYYILKQLLIEKGIPSDHIAFIHDAASETEKAELIDAMNKGVISVCVGSTKKLGVGVNVQERLIALHHLDIPWKPADLVQREGRILRKGNTCEEVFIYHYVTQGTFDSFSWQVLEKKAKFLDSFLSGIVCEREVEDIDDIVLRYSEIKALCIGNPLIKQRVETANRLNIAKTACRNRQRELHRLRELVEKGPEQIAALDRLIAIAQNDNAAFQKNCEPVAYEERLSFGEELSQAIKENVKYPNERRFDEYRGFQVFLPSHMAADKPYILIRSRNGGNYVIEVDPAKPLGCAMRIDHMLTHLPDRIALLKSRRKEAVKRMRDAQNSLGRDNPYQKQVEALSEQLDHIDLEIKERQAKEELERRKANGIR